MPDVFDLLKNLPLLSAATWFTLAALQIMRDRYHTWTEAFFLAACMCAGLYATGDWLFFGANDVGLATIYARFSLASVILTVLFLFLFTLVYIDRMRRAYWGFALISAGAILLTWTTRINISTGGRLLVPLFDPVAFLILLAYIAAFSLGGVVNLYRLHKIVRAVSPQLARRTQGFLIVFILVLILGFSSNGFLGATGNAQVPPPFSTLLLIVAAATIYTLYPGTRQRVSEAIRRFQARKYAIKAVFLTFQDGTLIGARARPGETVVDQDLFGATLDVIQNFMRTSFPMLRGKSLSSISHGSYTLVMERARYAYLTVVLEGQETDLLRRQMRDLLIDFESRNRPVLAKWQGIPAEAKGTEDLLSQFFVEAPMT